MAELKEISDRNLKMWEDIYAEEKRVLHIISKYKGER